MSEPFEDGAAQGGAGELAALREELERLRARNAVLERANRLACHIVPAAAPASGEHRDIIFTVTRSGMVHSANPLAASYLDQPPAAIHGRPLAALFPASSIFMRVYDLAVRSGEGASMTEHRDGRLYECRAFPVAGVGDHVLLVLMDISDRGHARQTLLHNQRVLEERIASRNAALQVQVQERLKAEENLRREQGFFRLVLDTDPSFISVYDAQGSPQLVNKAFAALFDFAPDTPLESMFHDGSPAWTLVGANAERVCRTGVTVHQECELEDALGTFRWYDAVTTPLRMPTGETLALCIATDVTDRKVSQLALEQAHSELEERVKERTVALAELNGRLVREAMERLEAQRRIEESEARFKGLFFANQAIKLLIDAETFVIVESNTAAQSYYGYSREEMTGLDFFALTLSDARQVRARNRLVDRDGTARFESSHRRKDGTTVDVEIFAGMIMDKGRKVIFAIVHDITERKLAERLVIEQRNHLTALMNAMNECALLLDVRGHIITLNTAAATELGDTEEHLVGSSLLANAGPESRRIFGGMLDRVLQDAVAVREEYVMQKKTVWDVTFYPVMDAQQSVVGAAIYAKDITARKQAEERLRWLSARVLSAQEEERKRIGRELHDSTAQTLSGIKFMVEADLAAMARANVPHDTRAMRKVVSLLQGAIIELRRIIMDLRPTVLDDLGLLSALRWLQDEFSAMHGNVNFRLWLDADERCLDEMQKSVLFRVAQEAITNVARHSGADALSLSLSVEGGHCTLTIADNGAGFSLEAVGSSGIGLDSMRERLELVDGHLHIVTEKGMGTQIQAVVPLRDR